MFSFFFFGVRFRKIWTKFIQIFVVLFFFFFIFIFKRDDSKCKTRQNLFEIEKVERKIFHMIKSNQFIYCGFFVLYRFVLLLKITLFFFKSSSLFWTEESEKKNGTLLDFSVFQMMGTFLAYNLLERQITSLFSRKAY